MICESLTSILHFGRQRETTYLLLPVFKIEFALKGAKKYKHKTRTYIEESTPGRKDPIDL